MFEILKLVLCDKTYLLKVETVLFYYVFKREKHIFYRFPAMKFQLLLISEPSSYQIWPQGGSAESYFWSSAPQLYKCCAPLGGGEGVGVGRREVKWVLWHSCNACEVRYEEWIFFLISHSPQEQGQWIPVFLSEARSPLEDQQIVWWKNLTTFFKFLCQTWRSQRPAKLHIFLSLCFGGEVQKRPQSVHSEAWEGSWDIFGGLQNPVEDEEADCEW